MKNEEIKFKKITEYIFAPFNTYVFLNLAEIMFTKDVFEEEDVIEGMNLINFDLKDKNLKIEWKREQADRLKISKGVFVPISKEESFIMGQVVNKDGSIGKLKIKEVVGDIFPENSLSFSNIRIYLHTAGVASFCLQIEIEKEDKISILELEKVSEDLNNLYKVYFQELCHQIGLKFREIIILKNIPSYHFEFLPLLHEFTDEEKASNILPWTHRIYHIHDDEIFKLENPGEPFRFLMTPSKKMDVEDLSIYDNRYIYFGWGHSIILTATGDSGYSQTTRTALDYVRVVEIAQVNWKTLEELIDLADYASTWFQLHYKQMSIKKIKRSINKIRDFNIAVKKIIDDLRGVKITYDTEKRKLLRELNDRWLTGEMHEKFKEKMDSIDSLLDDLYVRQTEKRDQSLNTIVLMFTIISLIEIFGVVFDVITPDIAVSSILKIIILVAGTASLGILILMYLRLAEKS